MMQYVGKKEIVQRLRELREKFWDLPEGPPRDEVRARLEEMARWFPAYVKIESHEQLAREDK